MILGLESSCDETSAAVVRLLDPSAPGDFRLELLSDVTARQEEVHVRFGGVVPELASRRHLESLLPVVQAALDNAKISYQDLQAVAVTNKPGLIGSLMIGVNAAKTIAYAMEIPLLPINHLEAHLAAVLLEQAKPVFPCLGLIISGGHTSLYEIRNDWREYSPLAHTRDDAAGEAFDKGARLLGLPYPGGPEVAKLAAQGNKSAYSFPIALPGKEDFSFSGLKTSLSYFLRDHKDYSQVDLCASYQECIVQSLVQKTLLALKKHSYRDLVIAGGVAANQRLREVFQQKLPHHIRMHIPGPAFCTDNGAMIAALGALRFSQGNQGISGKDLFSVEVSPRTEAKDARGKH